MSLTVTTEDSVAEECVLNHPHADIILRSSDSREFRVPRIYIIDSSPVLAVLIQASIPEISNSPEYNSILRSDISRGSLPTYHLSDRGDVLSSLLSYVILSLTPSLPPTIEKIMELLSVAQKYEMGLASAHIRGHISRQNPPLIRKSTAFHAYSLAQQYGLRQEALQAAQLTLNFPLSIESLESTAKLSIMPSPFLYELWRYHARVQQFLEDDLAAFITTGTAGRINIRCRNLDNCDVPIWLGDYVDSLASSPALFDLSEFHMTMMRHIMPADPRSSGYCQSCATIDSKTIDTFWTALKGVVQGSMEDVSVAPRACCIAEFLYFYRLKQIWHWGAKGRNEVPPSRKSRHLNPCIHAARTSYSGHPTLSTFVFTNRHYPFLRRSSATCSPFLSHH